MIVARTISQNDGYDRKFTQRSIISISFNYVLLFCIWLCYVCYTNSFNFFLQIKEIKTIK